MEWTYIILCAIIVYIIIRIVSAKRTETVKKAFAGAYDGNGTVVEIHKDRNKTIYTEGEKRVDLSGYDKFLISGRSLERAGIPDGVFVYTLPVKEQEIGTLRNRFVVFKYDNDRLREEHPEITNLVEEGYKARKVVAIFPNNMDEEGFRAQILPILSADEEIRDAEACATNLWRKYSFASRYYANDANLIVSITYKDGERKDYSFHSVRYLQGVVKYKSLKS